MVQNEQGKSLGTGLNFWLVCQEDIVQHSEWVQL